MKRLTAQFIFVLCIMTLSGCKKGITEDQYDNIMKRDYIIVGLDDTFVPMGFRDSKNEIVGFDVDLAKAVFGEMGLEVKFQPIDWPMKETELNNGTIDVIWNGYTITEERQKKVAFSRPYLENRQVIIVLKDSNIKSKNDLRNKSVGVQAASSSYDALLTEPNLVKALKNGEPAEYPTNDFAFNDLIIGRIDALIIDEVFGEYYITANNLAELEVLEEDFGTELYGVGFRKVDKKLLDAFNAAFADLLESGEAGKISERWFNEDLILYSNLD